MKDCKHRWEHAWAGTYQCKRCKEFASVNKENLLTMPNSQLSFANPKPNYMLTFHNKDQVNVGSFDFNEGRMHFEGDVTESGQIFVDWVISAFKQRVTDAVKAEREACAELMLNLDLCGQEGKAAEAIRARGNQ